MNEQIKQRINQLNNGEIPNGYKKTSVGIVPIEWTEHTLGDIFKFKNGINKEKEAFGQGTPIVNYTDVWKKRGLKAEDIKGRVVLSKNEIQNYEVKCGDVFFTRTSETIEEIGYSSVLLEDIENTIFSGFVLRARPYNNLVSREYHQYCYSEPQMRHEIIKRSSMTTRALTSGPMLSQVAINLPSHREQSKIAEILMKWDKAIELYNQQVEKLKQLKSIWLKKMFPQKGERVPEWRFKGFTDAWEQRKLGELSEKTYGGGTPSTANTEYWRGDIPWLQSSDIIEGELFDVKPKKYISQLGLNNSAAQLVPANSVAIITRVGVGKLAFLPFSYTTSQDFLSMSRLTAEPYFTVYACYKKLQSELNSVQGTSIKGITKDELLAKEIKVPSYEEQKQIGAYFRSLDNLITLHQCKVEKIKVQQKVLQKYLLNGIVRV